MGNEKFNSIGIAATLSLGASPTHLILLRPQNPAPSCLTVIQPPKRYLEIDPWRVVENGFHPRQSRVSESIFSLANEFMGIRGHFDEGYGGDSLVGSYFNGVFTEHPHVYPLLGKGFPERNHFMVNSVNWLHTRITMGGQQLDLAKSRFSDFTRSLDMRTGTLTRSFIWHIGKGRNARVQFTRFLSMAQEHLGCQRIEIEALDFSGVATVALGLDFSPVHEGAGSKNFWTCLRRGGRGHMRSILAEAHGSLQKVASTFRCEANLEPKSTSEIGGATPQGKLTGVKLTFGLRANEPLIIDRLVAHHVEKNPAISTAKVWSDAKKSADALLDTTFDRAHARHCAYWSKFWKRFDVTIEGDPANDQGTRYCIYQLRSTYHGVDGALNIGAKGLTGEVYGGLAFWDTETYCLPFYLFTDPAAAKNLLLFRYNTLPQARERARQLDCEGARYPMTTIDGTETCGVWYHGDLEIHVPAAVAYAIAHYVRVTGDQEFLYRYGLEMLIEISRFYASHGGWSPKTGEFGLWGVMGADEFHMMIHNNAYTNTMAKKTFEWTLAGIADLRRVDAGRLARLERKLGIRADEPANWKKMAAKMRLQRDAKSGVIEQHDGYFDLPHIDIDKLPPERRPVVSKFPYITRSRFDWIKQPDVLLLPCFFSRDYSIKEKRVNFELYEPRCIHESSLSPGIHAILAAELGMRDVAFNYVRYSSRLDLDDYNGNTSQGLHMTSMAAAWMSLVYGFGGMRSDGTVIAFKPSIPKTWKSFTFRVAIRDALLEIRVDQKRATFRVVEGEPVKVEVYGEILRVGQQPFIVPLRSLGSENV
jgi:maltose phosphorylase